MFQSFDAKTTPDQGPPRVADLRAEMRDEGVDVFLVPRADRFQGEYVAPSDERLAWLTGLHRLRGLRRDPGRQGGAFRRWPLSRAGPRAVGHGHFHAGRLARDEAGGLADRTAAARRHGGLRSVASHRGGDRAAQQGARTKADHAQAATNLVDRIWTDRPAPPMAPARTWPRPMRARAGAKLKTVAGDLAGPGRMRPSSPSPTASAGS
jgi:Xaa-Pro aminopeptidase